MRFAVFVTLALAVAPRLATTQTDPRHGILALFVAGVSSPTEPFGYGLEAWSRLFRGHPGAVRLEGVAFVTPPDELGLGCVTDPCEYRQVRAVAMASIVLEGVLLRRQTHTVTALAGGGVVSVHTKGAYLDGARVVEHARRFARQASLGLGVGNSRWRGEIRWRVLPGSITERVAYLTLAMDRTF